MPIFIPNRHLGQIFWPTSARVNLLLFFLECFHMRRRTEESHAPSIYRRNNEWMTDPIERDRNSARGTILLSHAFLLLLKLSPLDEEVFSEGLVVGVPLLDPLGNTNHLPSESGMTPQVTFLNFAFLTPSMRTIPHLRPLDKGFWYRKREAQFLHFFFQHRQPLFIIFFSHRCNHNLCNTCCLFLFHTTCGHCRCSEADP